MPNCQNDPGDARDKWDSIAGGQSDGFFKIDWEDPRTGNCTGRHFDSGGGNQQAVRGKCTGKRIHLFLPSVNPQFLYTGAVVDGGFVGFRLSLARGIAFVDPDDWSGDNPATFFGRKRAKKGAVKKAAGKKATSSKKTGGKKAGKKRTS